MYQINWNQVIRNMTPYLWRKGAMLSWLYALAKPINTINQTVIVPWRIRVLELLEHDGQTSLLERLLNAKYLLIYSINTRAQDIATADIIYIETTATNNFFFVWNDIEQRTPIYMYNVWQNSTTYLINDYVFYDNFIYRSLAGSNLGNQPNTSPAQWQLIRECDYFYNLAEAGTYSKFTVWVPTSIGGTYENPATQDGQQMRKLINRFRLAGNSNYQIKRY